jgi:hypothetical protein
MLLAPLQGHRSYVGRGSYFNNCMTACVAPRQAIAVAPMRNHGQDKGITLIKLREARA